MWRPCDGKKVIQKRSICAHHKCDSVRMSCVASQRAKGKEKNHSIVNPLSVGVVSDSSRTTIRSVVLRWWYMNVFTKLSNHFMRMIYVQHCCQRTHRTTQNKNGEKKSSLTPFANGIVTVVCTLNMKPQHTTHTHTVIDLWNADDLNMMGDAVMLALLYPHPPHLSLRISSFAWHWHTHTNTNSFAMYYCSAVMLLLHKTIEHHSATIYHFFFSPSDGEQNGDEEGLFVIVIRFTQFLSGGNSQIYCVSFCVDDIRMRQRQQSEAYWCELGQMELLHFITICCYSYSIAVPESLFLVKAQSLTENTACI